jgi:hypothetical protein
MIMVAVVCGCLLLCATAAVGRQTDECLHGQKQHTVAKLSPVSGGRGQITYHRNHGGRREWIMAAAGFPRGGHVGCDACFRQAMVSQDTHSTSLHRRRIGSFDERWHYFRYTWMVLECWIGVASTSHHPPFYHYPNSEREISLKIVS